MNYRVVTAYSHYIHQQYTNHTKPPPPPVAKRPPVPPDYYAATRRKQMTERGRAHSHEGVVNYLPYEHGEQATPRREANLEGGSHFGLTRV